MTADSTMSPIPFLEPNNDERTKYFSGIAGRLCVRSNCHEVPWEGIETMARDVEGHMALRRKVFVGVGHFNQPNDDDATQKLRKVYPKKFDILEAAQINWLWFAGIRIGYCDSQDVSEYPLVLYLAVDFDVLFQIVEPAARQIRQVLLDEDLQVHVPHVSGYFEVLVDEDGPKFTSMV